MAWFIWAVIMGKIVTGTEVPTSNNCSADWVVADWKIVPFPDSNAQYLSYQFKIVKGERVALRFDGRFPLARYMSYHVYNQKTEDPLSAVLDADIIPHTGSVNPYRANVNRQSSPRNYSLWALPAGSKDSNSVPSLTLPSSVESEQWVDIWYRVYLNEGKIEIPSILAFDSDTLEPTRCPQISSREWSISTYAGVHGKRYPSSYVEGKVPSPFTDGSIHFFRPASSSLGANVHIEYASARLDGKSDPSLSLGEALIESAILRKKHVIQRIGDVTVISFRSPSFPDTQNRLDHFTGNEEVRYWSLCVSGADTSTSECLYDSQAVAKGQVRVIVGPHDETFKKMAIEKGYHYLSHAAHQIPLLFYRQLLAQKSFIGNIGLIKPLPANFDKDELLPEYFAEKNGNEYAPVGKQCWKPDEPLEYFQFLEHPCEGN